MSEHVLENPAWHSLLGAHADLAEGSGSLRRYPDDVSPFGAAESWESSTVWDEIAQLVGPGGEFGYAAVDPVIPAGWESLWGGPGVQMVETDALASAYDDEVVSLDADDVGEMLDLVARTQPGPFRERTYLLGDYLGIRRDGKLIAMAGERMRPPGWTEISAVCTDPDYRGNGLASKVVLAVAQNIRDRGEQAMLHAAVTNTNAIRLYEQLGFVVRRGCRFGAVRAPR